MTIDLAASMSKLLAELSNGEWEHGRGITLENLDNPGWALRICIDGTPYEGLDFPMRKIERSEADWINLQVSQEDGDRYLCTYCGVGNLQEAAELTFDILNKHAGRAA
jgi:hypothetical protein